MSGDCQAAGRGNRSDEALCSSSSRRPTGASSGGGVRVLREDTLHCVHAFQVSAWVTFPDIPLAEPRIRWEGTQSSMVMERGWMDTGEEKNLWPFVQFSRPAATWHSSSRCSSTPTSVSNITGGSCRVCAQWQRHWGTC